MLKQKGPGYMKEISSKRKKNEGKINALARNERAESVKKKVKKKRERVEINSVRN